MLISVEALTTVTASTEAFFYWHKTVEFTHDCFVCRRNHRTGTVEHGADEGRCHSSSRPRDDVAPGVHTTDPSRFVHPAPVRLTAWDPQTRRSGKRDQHTLRFRLTTWYSAFTDTERGTPSSRMSLTSWARLGFTVGCRACHDKGDKDALNTPGSRTLQTNSIWPETWNCPACAQTLVTAESGPATTLLL